MSSLIDYNQEFATIGYFMQIMITLQPFFKAKTYEHAWAQRSITAGPALATWTTCDSETSCVFDGEESVFVTGADSSCPSAIKGLKK